MMDQSNINRIQNKIKIKLKGLNKGVGELQLKGVGIMFASYLIANINDFLYFPKLVIFL